MDKDKTKEEKAKSVRFEDEERVISHRSEACHNLVHQAIGTSDRIEYDNKTALLVFLTEVCTGLQHNHFLNR
jgi:hypothetical protein